MAKRRRKNRQKWVFRGIMLVLLVVAAVICCLVWNAYFKPKDEGGNSGGGETEVVEEIEEPEEDAKKEEEEEEPEVVEKEKVPQYEGDDPNESGELTGVVTYAGVNGGELMVRVNIDQYLNEGSCKLELLQNGAVVYNETTEITAMVTTATCDGFDVSTTKLNSGEYGVVVKLKSGGKEGVIRGEVNV